MSWADRAKESLAAGQTCQIKPHGNSMTPLVHSGDTVTVEPIDPSTLEEGDIVLCRVKGNDYLHLVKGVDKSGARVLIGNNHGRINGWASFKQIFGKATHVQPKPK